MTDRQFNKGDIIFKEGDSGECLYQIKEGVVGIYSAYGEADQQLLTELSAGKFFGEMAVIEAYPRSATAVALENGSVGVAKTCNLTFSADHRVIDGALMGMFAQEVKNMLENPALMLI